MMYTTIDLMKDFVFFIIVFIYIVIGIKVSNANTKACENDGLNFVPPSTKIGIVLFWLWDLIYVQFIYKEK